jgi:hypothetical protein
VGRLAYSAVYYDDLYAPGKLVPVLLMGMRVYSARLVYASGTVRVYFVFRIEIFGSQYAPYHYRLAA